MQSRIKEIAFLVSAYFYGRRMRRELRKKYPGKVLVYPSGNIDGLSYDRAISWRERLQELLGSEFQVLEFPELKTEKGQSHYPPKEKRNLIRKTDIALLTATDVVVMQLTDGMLTIGTIKEDLYSFWLKKPVVIWSDLKKVKESPWLDSTDKIFDTLDGAVQYLKNNASLNNGKLSVIQTETQTESKKQFRSIVISGFASSGKSTLAKSLAAHYEVRFVDGGDALKALATTLGYRVEGKDWWDTPAGMEFLSLRFKDPSFDKRVDAILMNHAREGVVVTSWTLAWLMKDDPDKPRFFWLDTDRQERIRRMSLRDGISEAEAAAIIAARDEENRKHYHELYDIDFGEDLSPFHHIIDGNRFPEEILEEVKRLVS